MYLELKYQKLMILIVGYCNKEIISQRKIHPGGMLVSLTYGTNTATLRATVLFVLMHSGIVNGYQLLCNAHTSVLEPHRGTAAFFFFTHYRPFPLFLFMCLSLFDSPISFLGCLYRTYFCY